MMKIFLIEIDREIVGNSEKLTNLGFEVRTHYYSHHSGKILSSLLRAQFELFT